MRYSEFLELMDTEFGRSRSRVLLQDHVLAELGSRTAQQALDAGEDPREVWLAVCSDLDVPAERRMASPVSGRRSAHRAVRR